MEGVFIESPLYQQIFGEMLGTFLLVLLGNGCIFSVSHKNMLANQPGKWVIIVIGWAIAVFSGALLSTSLGAPGHINPAVSLMNSFVSVTKPGTGYEALSFIPMQLLGAFLAQWVLYLLNWKFIKNEINENDASTITKGASITLPVYKKNNFQNFLYEFIGTSILLTFVLIVSSKNFLATTPINLFTISTIILGIGCSLGSVTGYALNPARDLGPRIAYQILWLITGKKMSNADWSYSWIPVIAPCLSGIIFGLITLV